MTRWVEVFTEELFNNYWEPIRLDASLTYNDTMNITAMTSYTPNTGYIFVTDDNGNPVLDDNGNPVQEYNPEFNFMLDQNGNIMLDSNGNPMLD
jgi:hypothetical protein